MSRHEYEVSKAIVAQDYPFYALIFAAMRQADTMNIISLRREFPAQWDELQARYEAPGGYLPAELEAIQDGV